MMLTAFKALVRKDVVSFLRDRRALVVSVVTPILIAGFFGFLFGGTADNGASRVPVAVVDHDGSVLSKAVIADLLADSALEVVQTTDDQARDWVRKGKRQAAIVFPVGFGAAAARALFGGADKPPVALLYDPSQSFVRPILEGLLTQHVMQQVTRALFSAGGSTETVDESLARVRANTGLAPSTRADLLDLLGAVRRYQASTPAAADSSAGGTGTGTGTGGGMAVPFALSAEAISSGPRYNAYAHSFAGMSVQFILFMGIDAGVALLLMRQQGLWQRLRAAPLSRATLLASRVAGTSLISLLILALVYLAAALLFGVRIDGSVLGFAAVGVAFAVMTATMGLMIAAVGRSPGATRGLSILAALILVMLGGAWVPTFLFPEWLQRVGKILPTRWAVDGFDAMTWRGLTVDAALAPVAVMLGWSVIFSLIALWRFDWEADTG